MLVFQHPVETDALNRIGKTLSRKSLQMAYSDFRPKNALCGQQLQFLILNPEDVGPAWLGVACV
jgi:hypothetical protein